MQEFIKPEILSGFMELLPEDQVLFDRIKATIERNFQTYGFWPLDTPAIEKSEVLLAKGGGETTKQIYRIDKEGSSQDQALRFDLTVPLARFVAQHASELAFPFRRYQIAKVYRGERSQKGRYREFYQCDIDIIGRDQLSLMNDAEIPSVIDHIFSELGISTLRFHMNNRRLLNGFFQSIGIKNCTETLRSIDKLAKIGQEKVNALLEEAGVTKDQQQQIEEFLHQPEDSQELLEQIEKKYLTKAPIPEEMLQGYRELKEVYERMQEFGIPKERIRIDLSITRGLDYYTGTVYESFLDGYQSLGSVCSGGRYDDLASNFSKEHLPGIGLSIGLTRLFYQLRSQRIVEPDRGDYLKVLVIPMGEEQFSYGIRVVNLLRQQGIRSQIYSESGKMKKKFSYADQVGTQFAFILGETEAAEEKISVKNLRTGDQETLSWEEAVALLSKKDR